MNPSCPSRDQLWQLLVDQLSPAERAALDTHVEVCTDCQETLAWLSDDAGLIPAQPLLAGRPAPLSESVVHFVRYLAHHPPSPCPEEPVLAGLRYRPVRLHARGGLGEVHVAEDGELHRQVALKRLRDHHAHNPHSRRRFLREAEITSRLEHPGVVPVYGLMQDADGQPCYAMRFIEGESLKDAIERFHAADQAGREPGERSLALRHLLSRFVAVCNTMAYAHSRGIVHRDLKPANILLGRYGETLLVDWGLAKPYPPTEPADGDERLALSAAHAAEADTQLGQALGTPQYMSPEQATGRSPGGPVSDIYGLGATLYCLLTGRAPFDGLEVGVVLDRARQGDFRPPRQVKAGVPPALEAVCLKAMAPRPEDRYPSARALADDVEHWLADEPVAVHREPWRTRMARWRRRHRVLTASLAAFGGSAVLALIAGTVLLAWANVRTNRERDKAQKAEARATAVNKFLIDALAAARPDEQGRDVTMQQVLDAATPKIAEVFAGHLEAEAAIRQTVGWTYHQLGRHDLAEPQLRRSLELYRDILGPAHPETLQAVNTWSLLLQAEGKLSDAEPLFRENLDARRRLFGPDHPNTVESVNNLAVLLKLRGNLTEAEPLFRDSLEASRRLSGPDHPNTLAIENNLAGLLQAQGKPAEAEPFCRHNLETSRRLFGPDHPDTLQAVINLAGLRRDRGKLGEAEDLLRPTLDDCRRVLGPDHPLTLSAVNSLAQLLQTQGKLTEAEPFLRQNLEARRRVLGPDHPDTLIAVNNLAQVFMAQGKLSEAEPLFRQSLEARHRLLGQDHPYTLNAVSNLAQVLKAQGKLNEAEPLLRQNLEARRRFPDHPDTLITVNNLARLLEAQGKLSEAKLLFRQNLDDCRRVLGPDHPLTLTAVNSLALFLQVQKKLTEAEPLFREVVRLRRKVLPADHPDLSDSLAGLGSVLLEQGQPHEAEPLLREAVGIRRRRLPPGHWRIASAENLLGGCLTALGRYTDAEPLLLNSYETLKGAQGAAPAALQQQALDRIIRLYEDCGKLSQAAAWRERRNKASAAFHK
jgi:non-specific serine/threonine protein kinase/serine/threonine-protein kinase